MASSAPPPTTLDIPLIGTSVHIARSSGRILLDLLQTRFHCEAQILGVDLDLGPGQRSHIVPDKRFETTLSSGVRVSVWKADLGNFSAVAVVNAANSKLQHHGGLALALSTAGGPLIQKESDDHVQSWGEVKTGEAVVLGAGNLQCKAVIHAVGPHLSFRPNHHEVSLATGQLERTIRSVLQRVEEKRFDTVAIPAISSGIFNFPLSECAEVIVSTVKKFYGSDTSHRFKPKEVLLVNNDDPTVEEMRRACTRLLLPAPVSYSQAAAAGNSPLTRGAAKSDTTPPFPQVQLGTVRVILRKGNLEEQKMDVIVNTIGPDRNLSMGQVSKMLLKKAGSKMQDQIKQARSNGSVIITQGFKLDCKEVYHTCCPSKSIFGSDQVLFKSVQDCLWLAVASQHSSIAFPAIGTGNLGFGDEEAAQIMLNAVWDFFQKCVKSLNVHFVIFPSDVHRFKAFEKQLKSLQPKAFQMEPPQNFPGGAQSLNSKPALPPTQASAAWAREDRPEELPPQPCLRLHSHSDRSRSEAEAWVTSLLHNQENVVCICNNFIQHLGDKQLQELSNMEVEGVQVEEFLEKGRSGFVVSGNSVENIAFTALRLEQKIQEAQRQYEKEEHEELRRLSQKSQKSQKSQSPMSHRGESWEKAENQKGEVRVTGERIPVSRSDPQLKVLMEQLKRLDLKPIKAEKVENPALEKLFNIQKTQMPSRSSEIMLQLVSARFCDMVCQIGFRPECAPPDDACLGEGLYFAKDVKTALDTWTDRSEAFLYLFVAEVLKGKSERGRPGLVLGPSLGPVPETRCDSVEGSKVTVVFSHLQAMPRFLLTCQKSTYV
ncbi:protein mono-ADP-ribosyltransferase PARP9-like [Boleophthalmus pectinirostris]|uniref:protein mono-ADP-ribosyltransferase PARP9-like n=1 Tax=Boleophthalmus pectinirostris TaxID=150288 RepID=UPI00242B8E72|nr:protein mono-ADP-ribosyltransferase PARP9-like [Boleophthalmus pectinirostris]